MDLQKLVRQNIISLKPYSSARDEFSGEAGVFLDGNENPFGDLNRYPDPHQQTLKDKLKDIKKLTSKQVFIGNGSDEVIDLLIRIFCNPSVDKIIVCPPTYGMYEVAANINDVMVLSVPLTQDFQLDTEALQQVISQSEPNTLKLIFLCTPNNPTGNSIDNIEWVLANFNGIVVVDEAYIDFSERTSFIEKLALYPNLVVVQTFSKAWGLAAARIGIAYASETIIALMQKVKPPYNVSSLNQEAALKALDNEHVIVHQKAHILEQRTYLETSLSQLPIVKKVFPSDANFILIEVEDADKLYEHLVIKNIVVRNRNTIIKNCLRITIGTIVENQYLIEVLKRYNS
ncbi:MAG: Histidinol-phosphate aminotransferase [Bacteroidota bacterium]